MIKFTEVGELKVGVVESAKGEANDCTIRALVACTGKSYEDAHRYIAQQTGRIRRRGAETAALIKALDGKTIFGKFFESFGENVNQAQGFAGLAKVKAPAVVYRSGKTVRQSTMTMGTFLKTYTKGTYYILLRGHALAIVDGVIYGNTNDAKRLKARILGAFEVR